MTLSLAYETYGKKIPRNTIDQVKINKKTVLDITQIKRGCVIFWDGHVCIMTDRENCIHANAFHMKTIIEPLKDVLNRTNDNNKIIKIMNFN